MNKSVKGVFRPKTFAAKPASVTRIVTKLQNKIRADQKVDAGGIDFRVAKILERKEAN